MTLHVRHASRLDLLADELAEQFAQPPSDPFERIVVAVPTAGVRDWLTRRLAERLGIAANITMPFPGRFLSAALGTPLDADDPWQVDRLTWAVLEVLDSGTVDVPGWRAATGDRSSSGDTVSRRYATARRIADLFDRYATARPQILQQWRHGAVGDGTVGSAIVGGDDGGAGDDSAFVGPLDDGLRWQYDLWRAVRDRIGVPHRAERLPELIDALRAGRLEPSLPASVAMFGVGALAPSQIGILTALGAVRDVSLSVVAPSPARWQRTAPLAAGRLVSRRRFDDEHSGGDGGHPLVRSWGRLATETAAIVRGVAPSTTALDADADRDRETESLLAHIQHDIRLDRAVTPYTGPAEPPRAGSLQVHACHGVSRQLEVLRDVLGHLFENDPSLQPRDVLIMCPDLARFEPFARAVFQRGTMPVPLTVTDLSLGAENPVAAALATIMGTVADRCTAVDVLGVAALEPVRRRLGITVDDLTRFATWAERLGANWGLDVRHRAGWLGVTIEEGTWDWSLQSLLLGSAMPAPEPRRGFDGIVPFDDVAGTDLSAAGRLSELIARLQRVRDLAAGRGDVPHWQCVLVEALGLLCAADPTDSAQMADVLRAIDDLGAQSTVGDDPVDVSLGWSDVRRIVDSIAARDPGRLSLRSGRVTMTGMVPVRNVPAKVVCLLGFDEVSLRPPPTDGDDLLAVRPCVGERDRRREQRQLVLDAVMAAERHLVVVCDGSDITTNRRLRFPVQLTELLDVVGATLGVPPSAGDPANVESPVLVRHPRRPYDEQLFTDCDNAVPFSFDDTMVAAAAVRRAAERGEGVLAPLRWAVDVPIPTAVTIEQLTEACTRPARTLLRSSLDVRLPGEVGQQDMNIPLSVSHLESSSMGQRLLDRYRDAAAEGGDWTDVTGRVGIEWAAAEALRAGNPPGRLTEQALGAVAGDVAELLTAIDACEQGVTARDLLAAGDAVDVDLTLRYHGQALPARDDLVPPAGALRLTEAVGGIAGNVLARVWYRRSRSRHLLGVTLELAAVVAATQSTDWRAVLVTRGEKSGAKPLCQVVTVRRERAAAALLDMAAELRVAALRSAVPLFEETSRTFHEHRFVDEEKLFGSDYTPGDLGDDDTGFVWGAATVSDVLTCEPSFSDLADALWSSVSAFARVDALTPRRARR